MQLKVLLYIPNIIGYARIALLFVAYYAIKESYFMFFISYFLSFVLDALDGIAARALNQCSKFGAVLDMLTDRMATLVVAFIAVNLEHSPLKSLIIFIIILDLASHWLQTLVAAESGAHHKNIANKFKLLDYYYQNKFFMCPLCVGYEFFFLLYIYIHTTNDHSVFTWMLFSIACILGGVKSFINIQQLISNALIMVDKDVAALAK
jgi:CDP-diacylglycerol--inositol 3-phosphatidyltransferase